jgi:hypothetical protein
MDGEKIDMSITTTRTSRQRIHQAIDALPEEGMDELVAFVKSLQLKFDHEKDETRRPFKPVNLPEGILVGYEFSPELIAEARRIMWPEPEENPL